MIDEETSQLLADEIIGYIKNKCDDKEEKFLKSKPKKNRQGVITNGGIIIRLVALASEYGQEKDAIEKIKKSKKEKKQTSLNFLHIKYENLLKLLGNSLVDGSVLLLTQEYQEFVVSNNEEHIPATWLSQWCGKAKDISFATHVGKLTHSSSKSSSILDQSIECNNNFLTTNSLNQIEIDTASSNAASLPIAGILKISVNGTSILDCLKEKDMSPFSKLNCDDSVVNDWYNRLKLAYDGFQKKSYFLSKQIYFPLSDDQYHLLLPLTSSSLVHALHLEHKKYWNTEQEFARKQKSENKYLNVCTKTYPDKAFVHVTGSNHSNASSLNGVRGGRIALLATMPPPWNSRLPTYENKKTMFDKALSFELKVEIRDLNNYLLLIKSKALSISEPRRNGAVIKKLRAIAIKLFNYLEDINYETGEGWTLNSGLPDEQQLLFEPWREDIAAKAIKLNNQWQKSLSQDYGRWLNQQLSKKKQLALTAIHAALWADCFAHDLRERVATMEVVV